MIANSETNFTVHFHEKYVLKKKKKKTFSRKKKDTEKAWSPLDLNLMAMRNLQ